MGYFFKGTGGFHVWNLMKAKQVYQTKKQNCEPRSAAFSPDGRLVAWVWDQWIHLVELATGKELLKIELGNEVGFFVGFTSDGQHLLTESRPMKFDLGKRAAGHGGSLRIWDIPTGKMRRAVYTCKNGIVTTSALSPDGRIVAFGVSSDDSIRVVDLCTCQEVYRFQGRAPTYNEGLVFSRNGAMVASDDHNNPAVHSLDLRTGKKIRLAWEGGANSRVLFSACGQVLAASKGRDQKRSITNLENGKKVFWSPDDRVHWLTASGDLEKLVQYGIRGSKLIWELSNIEELDLGVAKAAPRIDLQPPESETLWNQLAASNARQGLQATWRLADGGDNTCHFLAHRLHPIRLSRERVDKLIGNLDDHRFSVREAAFNELDRYDRAVEGAIRDALKRPKSLEVRRRLEELLTSMEDPAVSSKETLQVLRAIAVLEYIGTAEAKAILKRMSEGAPLARQTREARMALARLGSR
jgi:WD40 repeat protein